MSVPISGANVVATPSTVTSASWAGPPQQKFSSLFNAIDTSGAGLISKAQFEQAFATRNPPQSFQKQGVQAIYNHLDPAGTGVVSKGTFVSVMSALSVSLRSAGAGTSVPVTPAVGGVQPGSSGDPAKGGHVNVTL